MQKDKKMRRWYLFLFFSVLLNILVAGGYIIKNDVKILTNDYLADYAPKTEKINYNEINRAKSRVSDGDMAIRLVKAYLGDHLNYREETLPLFTTKVFFDEEKYEYLVEILVKQTAGASAETEERFLVGIRKDYGIVTIYEFCEEVGVLIMESPGSKVSS